MFEIEGVCPLCFNRRKMKRYPKFLCADGIEYTFRRNFWYCSRHGYFVWSGRKHQLFDFIKRRKEAVKIKQLDPEIPDRSTLEDYRIVNMRCPECGSKWKQYNKTETTFSGTIFCLKCGAEFLKEHGLEDARARGKA